MKQEATEKVLVALRRILSGEIYVSERIANSMLQHYVRGSSTSGRSSVTELTDRELEVFRLSGGGHGTRQIADELRLKIRLHLYRVAELITIVSAHRRSSKSRSANFPTP